MTDQFKFLSRPQALREVMHRMGNVYGVAVAESLTAGHVQAQIASAAGSSRYFRGGITAYTHDAKVRLLGVDPVHAAEVNCVSERVAHEMALGAARMFGAEIAVATTGYAEVDLTHGITVPHAYIAVATPFLVWKGRVEAPHRSRLEVQQAIAAVALDQLLHMFEKTPGGTWRLVNPENTFNDEAEANQAPE